MPGVGNEGMGRMGGIQERPPQVRELGKRDKININLAEC